MNRADLIRCTIHARVEYHEHQYDDTQYLPDVTVEATIRHLAELLGLLPYLAGPQEATATLHTHPDGPALDPRLTLSAAGVTEDSALWLVLTPRFLPLTIHWTTGRHSGTQALLLQADTPLSAQLHILLDTLGVRERVDGPMKSTATLTQAPGGPPLPLDKSLLELQVRSHSSIWLVVVATCLPVVLHWHDGQREGARRVFLEGARTLGKLADEQARLIPAARLAINGPEHCRVALRTSPAGPDLPAERTLNEVAVEEDDALWLVWSPTVAEVVLHYSDPVQQTARTRKVFVPLTLAIHDIKKDVAQQAGLPNPHEIHLAGAPDGQAWPDRDTLEQYEIQTGSMVWVRVDQPGPAAVAPTPALAVLVAIVVVVIGSVWLLVSKDSSSALATTPTALPGATRAPAARPQARRTPTGAADTQLRADYEAGLAAYRSQAWPEAAGFFKRVYSRDPHYQDVTPILAELHYHWATQTLTGADRVDESLAILGQTFVYSPTHTTARQLKQRLELYRDGRKQLARAEWQAAIKAFTRLRAVQPDFLDVSQRLYDAYMGSAQQLREAGEVAATREQCTRAFEMPVADTSAAQTCLAGLEQPPTALPATPTQPPLVLVTVPDVRGADVGKARDFLRARGFRVAVTELTRPADIGALCNGMVSYSSPPKGQRIPSGSLVRLYYRGYKHPNPAQCG